MRFSVRMRARMSMMSEEEYQKLTELLKQKSVEIMAIEDRYILEDGTLIEI